MVAEPSGRVVASTDALLTEEVVSWPELRAAPGRSSSATVELRGTSYLIAAAPILTNPTAVGEPINQLGIALIAQPSPSRLDSLITAGVPDALTRSPIAMPARGARGDLTEDEVRRVAAYVWAISGVRGEPWPGGHASHAGLVPAGSTKGTAPTKPVKRSMVGSVHHREERP